MRLSDILHEVSKVHREAMNRKVQTFVCAFKVNEQLQHGSVMIIAFQAMTEVLSYILLQMRLSDILHEVSKIHREATNLEVQPFVCTFKVNEQFR